MTQNYGFQAEVVRKYGNINVWKYCCDVFNYLPLAALIEGSIMCVHGGISPKIISLDQISVKDRFGETQDLDEAISDLVWSDPEEDI